MDAVRARLPALRKAHGRIIQVNPCAPATASLFDGPSSAARAAVEAFSAAYRAELEPFGIEVLIASACGVEAQVGGTAKDLAQIDGSMTPAERKLYGRLMRVCQDRLAAAAVTDGALPSAERVIDLATHGLVPKASA